jgi:hypothetical protein
MKNKRSKRVTITGFIIPNEWDKRGNVVVPAIVTDDFEKYIIADNAIARELIKLIDEEVKVDGTIKGEDVAGNHVLKIFKYETLNNKSCAREL